MRHLEEDDSPLGDYVAKPGDYGYFDWDKVDAERNRRFAERMGDALSGVQVQARILEEARKMEESR